MAPSKAFWPVGARGSAWGPALDLMRCCFFIGLPSDAGQAFFLYFVRVCVRDGCERKLS